MSGPADAMLAPAFTGNGYLKTNPSFGSKWTSVTLEAWVRPSSRTGRWRSP
jgi:hypothetical protein